MSGECVESDGERVLRAMPGIPPPVLIDTFPANELASLSCDC